MAKRSACVGSALHKQGWLSPRRLQKSQIYPGNHSLGDGVEKLESYKKCIRKRSNRREVAARAGAVSTLCGRERVGEMSLRPPGEEKLATTIGGSDAQNRIVPAMLWQRQFLRALLPFLRPKMRSCICKLRLEVFEFPMLQVYRRYSCKVQL